MDKERIPKEISIEQQQCTNFDFCSRSVHRLSYLAAHMLSQPWPAGGAVIDDGLLGSEDAVSLRGVFFIASVDDQATHFDQAIPVILVEVGRTVLIPAGTHSSADIKGYLNASLWKYRINILCFDNCIQKALIYFCRDHKTSLQASFL